MRAKGTRPSSAMRQPPSRRTCSNAAALVAERANLLRLLGRRPGAVAPGEQHARLLDELAHGGDPGGQLAVGVEVGEAGCAAKPVAAGFGIGEQVGRVDPPAGEDVRARDEAHRRAPAQEHHLECRSGRRRDAAKHDDRGGRLCGDGLPHAHSMHPETQEPATTPSARRLSISAAV